MGDLLDFEVHRLPFLGGHLGLGSGRELGDPVVLVADPLRHGAARVVDPEGDQFVGVDHIARVVAFRHVEIAFVAPGADRPRIQGGDLEVHADRPEFILQDRRDLAGLIVARHDQDLRREAAPQARLLQQGLGLGHVVRIRLELLVPVQHRRQHAPRQAPVAEEHRLQDRLVIDGVVQRLTDPDVAERLAAMIVVHVVEPHLREEPDGDALDALERLDLVGGHVRGDVQLAAAELEHPGVVVGQHLEAQLVQVRVRLLPVVGIPLQHQVVVLHPFAQDVGSAAHGVLPEGVPLRGHLLLGRDRGRVQGRIRQEGGRGRLERDHQGMGIRGRRAADQREVVFEVGVLRPGPFQRGFGVGRRQRSPIRKRDPVTDVQDPGLPVGAGPPGVGGVGLDAGAVFADPHQLVVRVQHRPDRHVVERHDGVETRHVAIGQAHPDGPAVFRPGADREHCQRCDDHRDACGQNPAEPLPCPPHGSPLPRLPPAQVAMAAPSDAYAALPLLPSSYRSAFRFRSCGGARLVSKGSGRDGRPGTATGISRPIAARS